MTPHTKRRLWRANHEVQMGDLMMRLGYRVRDTSQEQQFACDLHGPDKKPSARLYPRTNSSYCWVCHKARRPTDLMMERENVGLLQAIAFLEEMYHLPALPDAGPEEELSPVVEEPQDSPEELPRLSRLLFNLTRERAGDMGLLLWAWEKMDQVEYLHSQGNLDAAGIQLAIKGIRERLGL